jgi:hypothetical protein
VFGLSRAVAYQAVNQDSGANVSTVQPNGTTTYTKDPPQPALAGSSALMGTAEGGFRGRLRALGAGTAAMGRSAWTRVRPNRTAAK